MKSSLFTHPACLDHDTGPGHPECRERLEAIYEALAGREFAELDRREAPLANKDHLLLAHDPLYVERVLSSVPIRGHLSLDGDTYLSPGSGIAALAAAGAMIAAIDSVLGGDSANAFCAIRPPGHHAERDMAMGFCLFNNVAIGARYAQKAHGIGKVAIVDFDVHHGNGTQHIFATDSSVFYASIHQMPLYPGTGARSERGLGNICNVPLAPGSGSENFEEAMEEIILPALEGFKPEFLLISAGFDAHSADPLAQLELETEDFFWVTQRLAEMADRHAKGRIVSSLEGGYDLEALGESVAVHMQALMESAGKRS